MGFKYVMLEVELGEVSQMVPIIFPDFMIHEDIAKCIQDVLKQNHQMDSKAVSAGDINYIGSDYMMCFGESETLKLSADPKDARIIITYEYLHGIKE